MRRVGDATRSRGRSKRMTLNSRHNTAWFYFLLFLLIKMVPANQRIRMVATTPK